VGPPGSAIKHPVPQASFNGKPFDQVTKPNQTHDHYSVDENGQTRILKATKKDGAPKSSGDA
jgi:hypothetical protein